MLFMVKVDWAAPSLRHRRSPNHLWLGEQLHRAPRRGSRYHDLALSLLLAEHAPVEEMREEPERQGIDPSRSARAGQRGRAETVDESLRCVPGMAFSNIVMFAIIVATAATLGVTAGTTSP